ncbi:hypothetical protein SNOG_15062 [Parastagonospora nodorum SN15]|uniref:Extracellular membrane protein CFEM domain-containing protein n=1 Tax=Phaeosphaeria nodorum (strain SN15 / ATCC MYA-4574 / FGSC 10173) TaxID=321614 RepID=Q0TZP5_PHANO|nr:hypothetical protein SNOG_15062 [Parastagonospora nodorum SN15]EAT77605.2 hypothetical protein SNOG_15062 [Parastagonospora nodorum SN15]
MWSATLLLIFAMQVAARGSDVWLGALPNCWQRCFANTEDGCSSSSCKARLSRMKGRADNTTGVCSTAESSESYLSKAVSCAVQKCDAEEFALELALGPLQLLCFGLGCPISKDVMDEAYAAASDTEPSAPNPTNNDNGQQWQYSAGCGTDSGRPIRHCHWFVLNFNDERASNNNKRDHISESIGRTFSARAQPIFTVDTDRSPSTDGYGKLEWGQR